MSTLLSDRELTLEALVARRWRVVLLGAVGEWRKVPTGDHWQITDDVGQITKHLDQDGNIGLVVGEEAGVAVLDVDYLERFRAMEAALGALGPPWVATAGGYHLYLKWEPALPPAFAWRDGGVGQIKRGGTTADPVKEQVVMPPSIHPDGPPYEWLVHPRTEPLIVLPDAWRRHLRPRVRVSAPSFSMPEKVREGERNTTLYRLGRSLKAKGLSLGAITAALEAENTNRCAPPLEAAELLKLSEQVWTQADRPGFALSPFNDGATSATAGPILIRLSEIATERVEWAWLNRIARGKLALVIGEPGEGKSHVTHDLTARMTRGAMWPDGGQAPEGNVVILSAEDGVADTVRPRIDKQGGDAAHVYVVRAVRINGQEFPLSLDRDLTAIEQALQSTGAVLLVIDPVSAYLGSKDSYKDAEIRGILSPLAALAERYHVAVVGVLHLTKAAQRRLLLRAQGSVAFVAQARTVLVVGQDPDQPGRRLLASIKNNLGPTASTLVFRISDAGLTWDDQPVDGTAESLLATDEPPTRTDQRERDEAALFLQQELKDGPVASKTVEADAKANGIAQRTLWRAKSRLGIRAERAKNQDGRIASWYWLPPEPR